MTWNGAGGDNDWNTGANWVGGAPVATNPLNFGGATRLTPNNNIAADTAFSGITFDSGASAFTLSGNRITLTGDVTNNSASLQTINNAMILSGATRTFNTASGNISLGGVVSGTQGLTKTGTGILTLSSASANTMTGAVVVNGGVIRHAGADTAAGGLGSASSVTINNGGTITGAVYNTFGSVVSGGKSIQINTGGVLEQTAMASHLHALVMNGGTLQGGVADNLYGNFIFDNGVSTLGNGSTSTMTGGNAALAQTGGTIFNIGNGDSLNVSMVLDHPALIGVDTGLIKQGTGTMTLSGANAYQSATTVSTGVLNIQNATALGTTGAGTSVSGGAALQIQGGITVGAEALTLNGTGVAADGALRNISGTNSYGGLITLGSATRINSDAGTLNITTAGTITGPGFGLTVGGAGNTAISSIIGTGSGTLTKDGSGTATLTGANTYTGTTTISNGALNIRNATALGTTAGGTSVSGGAALQIQGGITVGAEALTLNGTGVAADGALRNISGTNSYGGLITLGSATRINSDAGTLNITNAGTITGSGFGLTVGGAGDTAISSIIGTGSGTVTKDGDGTATLIGASTYTGATTVNAGTLQAGVAANAFGSNSAVSLSNTAGAILALNGFSNAIGSLSGGGTTGGNVTLGTETLTTGGDNTSTSYGGVISGTGAVIKTGTGRQTFTGTNTTTGTLTINGGSGIIGTALGGSWAGDVIANSGGRLGGNGTIGGSVTINSGSTYAVGNSPGIQSILGNLTLASGSRTEIEIGGANPGNGSGFHDQINVTGTVTIQGGTIAPMTVFSGSSGYSPTVGQRFAAITGSAITGTFDTIDNSGNPAWVSFIPEYTGTVVYMRTTASEFANNPLLNLSGNESTVGKALDSFRPATIVTGANATDADRIYGALTLLNNQGLKSAIAQMSPEKLSAMPQVAQSIGSQSHAQVNRQLELRRGFLPSQGDFSIYNRNGQTVYEPVAGISSNALFIKRKPEKLSFFASVNGEQGEVKPSQQRTDYDYWTATAVYGGNYALSQSLNLGLFTGYGHSNTSLGGAGGEIDYDTGKFGGYLSWSDEGWFVNGTLSGGKSFYKTERRIAFLSETALGKTEAWEGVGELRAGKDLSYGKWTLSPSIWQRYSQTFIDSYEEQGSSARLNIKSMKPESMVSGAGMNLQRGIPMGGMSLIPRIYANYEREWIRSQEIRAGFAAGGTTFQISSDPIDADQLTAGLGTTWIVSDNFQIDLSMEAETLQNDLQRRSANLSCKFSF